MGGYAPGPELGGPAAYGFGSIISGLLDAFGLLTPGQPYPGQPTGIGDSVWIPTPRGMKMGSPSAFVNYLREQPGATNVTPEGWAELIADPSAWYKYIGLIEGPGETPTGPSDPGEPPPVNPPEEGGDNAGEGPTRIDPETGDPVYTGGTTQVSDPSLPPWIAPGASAAGIIGGAILGNTLGRGSPTTPPGHATDTTDPSVYRTDDPARFRVDTTSRTDVPYIKAPLPTELNLPRPGLPLPRGPVPTFPSPLPTDLTLPPVPPVTPPNPPPGDGTTPKPPGGGLPQIPTGGGGGGGAPMPATNYPVVGANKEITSPFNLGDLRVNFVPALGYFIRGGR